MRRHAIAASLLLTACSRGDPVDSPFNAQAKADQQAARERAAVQAGFSPPTPAPLKTVSVDPPKTGAPGLALPGADRQYRYLGRWAATAALCTSAAWRFETRKLTTAGGTHCDLPDVAVVPSGYELSGTCRTDSRKVPQTLKLAFDEGQRVMTVSGGTVVTAARLIYCGD